MPFPDADQESDPLSLENVIWSLFFLKKKLKRKEKKRGNKKNKISRLYLMIA